MSPRFWKQGRRPPSVPEAQNCQPRGSHAEKEHGRGTPRARLSKQRPTLSARTCRVSGRTWQLQGPEARKCPQGKGHGWPQAVAPGQVGGEAEPGRSRGLRVPGKSSRLFIKRHNEGTPELSQHLRRGLCLATKQSVAAGLHAQEDRLPFPGGRGGRGEDTLVYLVILPPTPRAPKEHRGRGQRRKRAGQLTARVRTRGTQEMRQKEATW